ncbi:MAG: glycoside hydrolase family 31 protein [Eubacteriales bacterium]|nr:glycoside hydrolase family 31 protein [Eubacteriales bacterium]
MRYEFPIQPGEFWWGGTVASDKCPLTVDSEYHQDFFQECGNQTMPFFVSSEGWYLWSDNPFRVDVAGGVFVIEGEDVRRIRGGSNLREAYCSAMRDHFPCDGKVLPEAFFRTAQYNTWMEFTYYPTQEGVLAYAREYLKNGFAPGVLILDEGWHGRYGTWEFDFARFPDPRKMVDELHAMGFTVLLWVVPYVCADGVNFVRSLRPLRGTDPEMAKHLYMRNEKDEVAIIRWWNGYSAVLNLSNPYDAKFLDDQLQHLMRDYGVDGFKFDGGTPAAYNDRNVINGSFKGDMTPHALNIAWNEFGYRYPYHEYKDTYKGGGKNAIQRLRDKGHRWDGDGINQLIPCALTCGLIGHPFVCPDMIGGGEWSYNYLPGFQIDEELFVRMAQCSALFPMMQFSWAPWKALSPENMALCRDAALLHQRMSDEILRLVRSAEKSGEPILRALEYNDPHKGYAAITDQFMLGEDILVAPVVTKGTRERRVVFPEGQWKDENGRIYSGNTVQVLPAPLEKLLWFHRC